MMTRAEFLDTINEWYDLKDFCEGIACRACDDICDDGKYNEIICEEIEFFLRRHPWYDLPDRLDRLPRGCEYYYKYSYGEDFCWEDADNGNRFNDIKNEVLEFCDENGIWEGVEDEEYTEYDEYSEDEYEEDNDCEEDFSEEESVVPLKEFLASSIITLS